MDALKGQKGPVPSLSPFPLAFLLPFLHHPPFLHSLLLLSFWPPDALNARNSAGCLTFNWHQAMAPVLRKLRRGQRESSCPPRAPCWGAGVGPKVAAALQPRHPYANLSCGPSQGYQSQQVRVQEAQSDSNNWTTQDKPSGLAEVLVGDCQTSRNYSMGSSPTKPSTVSW